RFAGPVIGITGSVGKTSTKDLTLAAMSASRRTWANERSLNNDFGLPTTVLNTPVDTQVMIVEMGMRGPGEIARLCRIAQPTIGVVTRVAEAHSGLLGGLDGVANAKAELLESLPAAGTAILNHDDARVAAMASRTDAAVLRFGAQAGADVRVSGIRLDAFARPSFEVATPWGSVAVTLGFSGAHMALNAAAALACVGVVGGDIAAGAAALAALQPSERRMAVLTTSSGGVLIDDSYNANPTSMRAGLDALAALTADDKIAVVGLMAEIDDPRTEHRAIAEYARQRGISVIAVGTDLYGFEPVDDPLAAVGPIAHGRAVLVKGSLVAGLGAVAAALAQA
ncbi:MAG TPA: UDP-N-acetylmuramoyl-tripeptide--D-alanyl-D-alanine ligase, partial [Ilumatobacteraceae bacterium]|nr:UDP-N-acetylmuramoyl-tripeptide--D-alanyl-D-alanine ligase [Ilumatobacteraceae bacterium]